jgi:hypothetical protein
LKSGGILNRLGKSMTVGGCANGCGGHNPCSGERPVRLAGFPQAGDSPDPGLNAFLRVSSNKGSIAFSVAPCLATSALMELLPMSMTATTAITARTPPWRS